MWKLQTQFFKFIILWFFAVPVLCGGNIVSKNAANSVIYETNTMDEVLGAVREINKKLTEIANMQAIQHKETLQLSQQVNALRNQNSGSSRKFKEYRRDEEAKLSAIIETLKKIDETFIEAKTTNQKSLQPLQEFSSTLEELKKFEEKQSMILENLNQSRTDAIITVNITNFSEFNNQLKLALDESSASYSSCEEAIKYNGHDGVYSLRILDSNLSTFKVYCLKDPDGNGPAWAIMQRRDEDSGHFIDFNRTWEQYKSGFGDFQYDHWLGLDNIFTLTNSTRRVLWKKSINNNEEINNEFYDDFKIADESRDFTITAIHHDNPNSNMMTCFNTPFNTFDRGNTTWVNSDGGGGGFWGPCKLNYNRQSIKNGKLQINFNLNGVHVNYFHFAIR